MIGLVEVLRNLERFLVTSIRLLNRAEQNGIVHSTAIGAGAIGLMLDLISMPKLANFYLRWAVSLADQSQHPKAISTAYYCQACHGYVTGDLNKSLQDALRAADAPRKIGDLRAWGLATWIAAAPMTYLGRFSESVTESESMIRLGEAGADTDVRCWGLSALGEVQRRLGQFDAAIANLEKGRALAAAIPDYRAYTISAAELGRCYLRTGNLPLAITILEESQRIRFEHNVRGTAVARLVNALAEAHLWSAGQSPDGIQKAGEACQAAVKHNQGWRIALPDAIRLQGIHEWLSSKPEAARASWEQSLTLAKEMGARYDAGLAHFEIGKRLGERAHLEKAEAIFADLGAEWDLAEAKKLTAKLNA
jgi:tetratricopeptide (TPR) repeat protein